MIESLKSNSTVVCIRCGDEHKVEEREVREWWGRNRYDNRYRNSISRYLSFVICGDSSSPIDRVCEVVSRSIITIIEHAERLRPFMRVHTFVCQGRIAFRCLDHFHMAACMARSAGRR